MNVLIIDDHDLIRAGLKQILNEDKASYTISEAKNAAEALAIIETKSLDIILLDIGLPGKSGLELLKQLRTRGNKIPVLILSMYAEDQYALRSLKAGAAGYITKECASESLIKAIEKIVRGGRYISESLGEKLAFTAGGDINKQAHEILSDREYQILCEIASGKSVSEIGEVLSLSVKTISTYRGRVLKKMNLKHNADITHYAIKNGLVE